MKTTVSKEKLHNALVNAARFTTGIRTQSEGLGTFLVFDNEKLVVMGIQENRFFQEEIVCDLNAQDKTVITTDTKKLTEFLQNISSSDAQLSLDGGGLRVLGGKSKALFPVAVKPEAPSIPRDVVNILTLDPKIILAILPQLLFCVASDSARPTLSSIKCIPLENNRTLFITTDGFRLSIVQTSLSAQIERSIQVPATFFRDVFTLVIDETNKAEFMFYADGRIGFKQGALLVGSQLVTGDFPPYDRVIVRNYQQNIVISRKDLIQSIKTIAIFTREHSNIVVFEIRGNTLKIRPKKEAGEENSTELFIEMQGQETEGLVIAFNYRYLLDFLSSVEDDSITMRVNRSDSPILFLAGRLESSDSHEGVAYQHIIMPVRIQE
jgi:DNA polymerase III beta subunit